MIEIAEIEVYGVMPLLQHARRLSDPLNTFSKRLKKISAKRKKVDEDYEEISRIEFEGSMYWDAKVGPYIPGEWIESCLRDGAKATKRGKIVSSAVMSHGEPFALEYDGPRDIEGLFLSDLHRDTRPVRVNSARVMRTRPIFPGWKLTFQVTLNNERLSLEDLADIAKTAGRDVGLGDFRPKYGRFGVLRVESVGELK